MTETAIKSKIGEGDGRKMTFFVQKMMNLQKFAISGLAKIFVLLWAC